MNKIKQVGKVNLGLVGIILLLAAIGGWWYSSTLHKSMDKTVAIDQENSVVEDQYLKKIKVGHLVALDMAPLFIAKEAGFFEDEGLEVETVFFSNPGDNNAALAGGSIQISINPFTLPYLGNNSKVPMRIVSSAGGLGIIEVVAQGVLNLSSMDDLPAYVKSKPDVKLKVGALKGDTLDMILYKSFKDRGLTYEDFEMVWFNDLLAMVQSFQTKQIDILSHIKPYTTNLVVEYEATSLINNSDVWGSGTPNCTAAVLEPFLNENPETIRRYLNGIKRAFQLMVDDPEKAVGILANGEYYKVPSETLLYALKNQPNEVILHPNIEGMMKAINHMKELGYIGELDTDIVRTEILDSVMADK